MRVFLTIVLPLALPTVLYLLWLRAARWTESGGAVRWQGMPWIWLVGAGVLLLAAVLLTITVHFGTQQSGVYVPPHLRDGQIVPGHIEPGPKL
jgi:hypothetical protein